MNNETERLENGTEQESSTQLSPMKRREINSVANEKNMQSNMISDYHYGSNNKAFENTEPAPVVLAEKPDEIVHRDELAKSLAEDAPLSPVSVFNSKCASSAPRQDNASMPSIAVTSLPSQRAPSKSLSYSSDKTVMPKKQTKLGTVKSSPPLKRVVIDTNVTQMESTKKSELTSENSTSDHQPPVLLPETVTNIPFNKGILLYELATSGPNSTSFNSKIIGSNMLLNSNSSGSNSNLNNTSSIITTMSSESNKNSASKATGQSNGGSIPNVSLTSLSTVIAPSSVPSSSTSSSSSSPSTSFINNSTETNTATAQATSFMRPTSAAMEPYDASIIKSNTEKRVKPNHLSFLPNSSPSSITSPLAGTNVTTTTSLASTGTIMTHNHLQSISEAPSQISSCQPASIAASSQSARLHTDVETKLKYDHNKELTGSEAPHQQPTTQQKINDDYEKNTRSPPPPSFAWSTSSSSSSSTTSLSKAMNETLNATKTGGYQSANMFQANLSSLSANQENSNDPIDIDDGMISSTLPISIANIRKRYSNGKQKEAADDSSASSSSMLSSASTLINQETSAESSDNPANSGLIFEDRIDSLFQLKDKYKNKIFDSRFSILMSDENDLETRIGLQKDICCSSSMKSFVDELPQFPSKAPLLGEISSECGSGSSFDGSNDETNPSYCTLYGNKLSPTIKYPPPSYISATSAYQSSIAKQAFICGSNADDPLSDSTNLKRASGVIDIQAMDDDSPVTYDTALHSKVDYIEDDKPIIPGIKVRAASIPKLIHLLVESFDKNGDIIENTEFPRVFLLMHKWFMESDDLFLKLRELYESCEDTQDASKQANPSEYQSKICHAYHYWIKTFPSHFALDCHLKEKIRDLSDLIETKGNKEHLQLVDISNMESYDWVRKFTTRNPAKSKQKISLAFNKIEPEVLANQLTFIEWKTLRRISFNDYKSYAIEGNIHNNLPLERSIQLFNGLSQWIQCMVLKKTTPKQRADIIHKFIEIAKHLRRLQNFNSLMAVVGGICHSAIARLSKTNLHLSEEDQKVLGDFMELLSSNYNYSQYRKTTGEIQNFWIPIIGIHLKDLISLHTAHLDKLDNDLINFRKMAQLSIIFQSVSNLQNSLPPVNENRDLIKLLQLSLDMTYSEDEIYEISLAREPRTSVSSPSTPTRISAFADWAKSISTPPDPAMIQKHVNAMVDAVFKNYDHDRDNFISHTEFNEIAQNFPFIDTFAVLDADKDGMISKSEMKCYFLKANYHALKKEFKHEFHETTYFKPTFCTHCSGLLWGLIKQGWKCKDCGINAHRGCKDQVVIECRPKRITRQPSNSGVGTESMRKRSSSNRSSMRKQVTYKQKGTQTETYDDLFISDESLTSADEGNGGNNNSSNASFNYNDMNDGICSIETTITNLSNSGSNTTIAIGKANDSEGCQTQAGNNSHQRSNNHQHRRRKKSPKRRKSLPSQCSSNEEPHPSVTLIPRGPLICSNSESTESWLLPTNPYTANSSFSTINSPTVSISSNSNTNVAATAHSSVTSPSSPLTINTSLTSNSPNILTSSPLLSSANSSNIIKPMSFTNPIFYSSNDNVDLDGVSNLIDLRTSSELLSAQVGTTTNDIDSSSTQNNDSSGASKSTSHSNPFKFSMTSNSATQASGLSKPVSNNSSSNSIANNASSSSTSINSGNKTQKVNDTNLTSKSSTATEKYGNTVRFKLQPRDSCYVDTRRVVSTKSVSADSTNDYSMNNATKTQSQQQQTTKTTPVKVKRPVEKKPLTPMRPSLVTTSNSVGTSTSPNGFSYNQMSSSINGTTPSSNVPISTPLAKNKIVNSLYSRERVESTDYDNNDDFHDDDQMSSTEEENDVFIKLKLQKAEEERKKLAKENEKIKQALETANAKISSLTQEMSCFKKDSVTVIMDKMDLLQLGGDMPLDTSDSIDAIKNAISLNSATLDQAEGGQKPNSSSDA